MQLLLWWAACFTGAMVLSKVHMHLFLISLKNTAKDWHRQKRERKSRTWIYAPFGLFKIDNLLNGCRV